MKREISPVPILKIIEKLTRLLNACLVMLLSFLGLAHFFGPFAKSPSVGSSKTELLLPLCIMLFSAICAGTLGNWIGRRFGAATHAVMLVVLTVITLIVFGCREVLYIAVSMGMTVGLLVAMRFIR